VGDALQIGDRLGERRHTAKLLDRSFARVVCRQGQALVAFEAVKQIPEGSRSGGDVVLRVERVVAAELPSGLRNDLHQSLGVLVRHKPRPEVGLGLDDRGYELRGQIVADGLAINDGSVGYLAPEKLLLSQVEGEALGRGLRL